MHSRIINFINMKKHLLLIPTFLMLSVVSNAQIDGLQWTNGQGSYKCTTNEDGNLALMGGETDFGEGCVFKKTAYGKFDVLVTGDFSDDAKYAEYREIYDGYDQKNKVIVFKNDKKNVCDIAINSNANDFKNQNLIEVLQGIYTDNTGKEYNFAGSALNGEPFEVYFYELGVPNCIKLKNGKIVMVIFSDNGIDLYNAQEDPEDGWGRFKKTTLYKSLKKKDKINEGLEGYYPFTSTKIIYPSMMNYFSKQQLRIMRNEIYARKGYVFSSADLKAHFSKMSWYKPINDNSKVVLSDLEQLNVDLIKAYESSTK